MYRHILVPIDDSELSNYTVSKALEFAKVLDARVTFFHARRDFGATESGALTRLMSPADYVEQAAGKARALLARAEVAADDAGVTHESVILTSDRPYEAIIDMAEQRRCDLIFMSSHGQRSLKELLLGTQTQKVLQHTPIPVLVSVVESNVQSAQMNRAISIIQGEHRSLRAVLQGLAHLLQQAAETGEPADLRLLRAMTSYFLAFRKALHHPKEEQYLFARLVMRFPAAAKLVASLESQHMELTRLLEELQDASFEYQSSTNAEMLERLMQAVSRYTERQWEHMKLEEMRVLPECRLHLTDDDWKVIALAFEKNGDPRFDKDREEGFDSLFASIMNMAERLECERAVRASRRCTSE